MASFFRCLVSEQLIFDWAQVLDWMFDDNRFPTENGWNKGYISAFTKKVKSLNGIKKGFKSVKSDYAGYPESTFKKKQKQIAIIANFSGESEGRGQGCS